jgi:hypothetical protein
MSTYTVHEPPPRHDGTSVPDQLVFVRDGFSFWAFALGPLWMLRHRLWLVLAGYVALVVGLNLVLRAIGASSTVIVVAGVLLALLVGFEAATLRRFTLARRRWSNIGVVVGDDLESAEQRFFDAFVGQAAEPRPGKVVWPAPESRPAAPVPLLHGSHGTSDVIGLFPQPGALR